MKKAIKLKKINPLTTIFLTFVFLILLTGLLASQAGAFTPVTLFINGDQEQYAPAPYIEDNRVVVPLRDLLEDLGATVTWKGETSQILIQDEEHEAILTMNSKKAIANGNPITLDILPFMVDNRVFVPLRFVSESLGAEVSWNAQTREIRVNHELKTSTDFSADFLPMAAEGTLMGCDYKLSNEINAQTILTDLGEPAGEGAMEGSYYLQYDNCMFHFDYADYIEKGPAAAQLLAIDYYPAEPISTPANAKKVLGQPQFEEMSELDNQWIMHYLVDDYHIYLYANSETSTITKMRLKFSQ
ncbi:copper amine oxidase N-terminal domain-containing protein [Marinicrinis sediminis]|uniref:Copper amine oxidase N-terminal domain-containing protein n=1 Tax=Marinicrinis sediminis TaxID=1652465 RepID=A0ABW5R5J6_9BACL